MGRPEKLDWRKSIIDLMKLVGMDRSLAARKQLATEFHYTGDTNDSASMNMTAQASADKARGERRESSSGIIELDHICCSARSLRRAAAVIRLGTDHSLYARTTRQTRRFTPMEMRRNNLFLTFCRVVFLALCVFLWSCEGHLFDSGSKEIAHGYRLKRSGDPSQFALLAPYDTGGIIIDEIGWRKPFIIARASGSQYWDRIDTDHAEHIRISDTERRSNPKYGTISIENADIAWSHLKPHKRLW